MKKVNYMVYLLSFKAQVQFLLINILSKTQLHKDFVSPSIIKNSKMQYINDKKFENINFFEQGFDNVDYEYCTFKNCTLANCDLSNSKFIDCEFISCDLSTAKIYATAFQNVQFTSCKMLGMQFDVCNPFALAVSFSNCILNHSVFYQLKLNKTQFNGSSLQEVDFSNAQLKQANFTDCDLLYTVFEKCNLEKSNFSGAKHYSLDPDLNTIKGAQFDLPEVIGLLNKYKIKINQ